MKVADILRPLGGMSHTAVLILFGILINHFKWRYDKESSPFHKVGAILVLDAQHLFVHLLNKVIDDQHQTLLHNRKKGDSARLVDTNISTRNRAQSTAIHTNLHWHSAAEYCCNGQISSMPIRGGQQLYDKSSNFILNSYLGSQAAIIFLASNICWVNSGTERALNGVVKI